MAVNTERGTHRAVSTAIPFPSCVGLHLACLLADPADPRPWRLERVARVKDISTTRLPSSNFVQGGRIVDPDGVRALGRLYDALLWQGISHELCAELERMAQVPVVIDYKPARELADGDDDVTGEHILDALVSRCG